MSQGEDPSDGANDEGDKLDVFVSAAEFSGAFSKDMISSLSKSLSMSNLIKISIKGRSGGFQFTDAIVISLTESIVKANIQLVDLVLNYHQITDIGLEEISRLFKPVYSDAADTGRGNNFLEGLDLEGNEIAGSCFEAINLTTAYDCPLVFLNVSCNPLSDEGKKYLAEAALKNKTLRQLSINSCGLELNSIILLITNLTENTTLQLLHMDRPLINGIVKQDEVADHLSRTISQMKSLCDVSLKYFNIRDLGARLIAESLALSDCIISLNLECNNIGIRGADALASFLMLHEGVCSLESLGLSCNAIGNDGAIAFAEALAVNRSLRMVTLRSCGIGPPGLSAIGNALMRGGPLRKLSLFGNDFDNETGRQYYDILKPERESEALSAASLALDLTVYVVDGKYKIAEDDF